MNRRTALSLITSTFASLTTGCLEAGAWSQTTSTDDPFPDNIESGERGGADTTLTKTIEGEADYEDGSIECAKQAHKAVRTHIKGKFDDLTDIGTGYGSTPEEYDGIAVSVSLTTATYNRDGEIIRKADIEFEELVLATPPTAYVETEGGNRVCAVPVYVTKAEEHVD